MLIKESLAEIESNENRQNAAFIKWTQGKSFGHLSPKSQQLQLNDYISGLHREIADLQSLIMNHNKECVRVCDLTRKGSHMSCYPRYGPDKRRTCPECPRDWMID